MGLPAPCPHGVRPGAVAAVKVAGVVAHLGQEPDGGNESSRPGSAIDRAGFAVISSGLKQCLADEERGEADVDRLEKLFLSFA